MLETIKKWFAWLKKATVEDDDRLSHVYSDGEQMWATNGYVLHALDVAMGKRGQVILNETGALQVDKKGDIPPFARALPQGEPVTSIVVSAEALRHAANGQEGFVHLSIYGKEEMLELSSGGKYALLMAMSGVQAWWFWRPDDVEGM
ncbi:MAG: hypothetical protein ACOC9Z_07915 [Chloroflexota bacterium]